MRVGIIGTNWGLMHVGGFRGAGAEIAALCGRDPIRTARVAERENIPLAVTDVEELCAAVDLVVVASPDSLHRAHVSAALAAGRPVLCEKPLAMTEEDAAEMADLGRRSGQLTAVNFPYRTLPPLTALSTWLAGRQADWLTATVLNSFAAGPLEGSGDLGGMSHLIDASRWLLGPADPHWVQASLSPGRTALHIGLGEAVAVITQLAASRPGIHGTWTIGGRDWQATFAGGYHPDRAGWLLSEVRGYTAAAGALQIAPGVEPIAGQREPWAQAHVETSRHVLAALAGTPSPILATFDDGLSVQRILAAAIRGARDGRRVDLG